MAIHVKNLTTNKTRQKSNIFNHLFFPKALRIKVKIKIPVHFKAPTRLCSHVHS
jgi:hypothetical protein